MPASSPTPGPTTLCGSGAWVIADQWFLFPPQYNGTGVLPNPEIGAMYYDMKTNMFYGYNGTSWTQMSGGSGNGSGGTVTSIGLSTTASSIFSVTGTPVTSYGNITLGLQTQSSTTVLAGPGNGSAAVPTFRQLSTGDISGYTTVPYYPSGSPVVSTVSYAPGNHNVLLTPQGNWLADDAGNILTSVGTLVDSTGVLYYPTGTALCTQSTAPGLILPYSTASPTSAPEGTMWRQEGQNRVTLQLGSTATWLGGTVYVGPTYLLTGTTASTTVASFTFPPNYFTIGKMFRITVEGYYWLATGTDLISTTIQIGSFSRTDTLPSTAGGLGPNQVGFQFNMLGTCRTTGPTAAFSAFRQMFYYNSQSPIMMDNSTAVVFDTTSSTTLSLIIQLPDASTNTKYVLNQALIEILN